MVASQWKRKENSLEDIYEEQEEMQVDEVQSFGLYLEHSKSELIKKKR